MALPEFTSLKLQLKNYVDNPFSRRTVAPHTREILDFAYKQVQSSEEIAKKMLLSSTSRLDFEIRVAVSKLLQKMYALRTHSADSTMHIEFPMDQLEDLKRDTQSFSEMLKNMAAEFTAAAEDDKAAVSSRIHEPKMVGLYDQYEQLKDRLTRYTGLLVPFVAVLVGMPGIGKTTLASKIFQDPSIVAHYDYRVWITVGRKCQLVEIPRRILAAVDPSCSDQILRGGDNRDIAMRLREKLKGKRYLIVLDDVWNRYMACHFRFYSEYNSFGSDPYPFPLEGDRGLVLITTRLQQQEAHEGKFPDHVLKMRLLDKEESWDLLRQMVFSGDQSYLPQLEKDGKKIAEKCQGLPLTIVTVADLLSKEDKTPQFWRVVAAKKNHKIFMEAYQKISKVLHSSYEELNHELRMCFLYMGVFPQDLEVPRSKLMNMWSVDGFLEEDVNAFQHPSAIECLDELVSNSLVMIYQNTIGPSPAVGRHQIKTCGLHSSLWHLSRSEASKTKFCHVLNVLEDCSGDYLQCQRRVSFHNGVLFGIKDVHVAVEGKCASTAHSLLCYGPYQQYQVPICFGLELLQELDALTIRFYEFPEEVLQLVELKYLALTLNGKLPASISKLSKLEFLIVGQHMSIKCCRGSSYLPMEIWNMKELKHLQVRGNNDLLDPHDSLENLSTLSDVSGQSCSERVVKAIPNLKRLGIRVELLPNDCGKSLSGLDHIYHLGKLEIFKYVIVNRKSVASLSSLPILPAKLRKLSLSGLGCSWGEISYISSLSFLRVLKLRNYAFVGRKWEVRGKRFRSLESLVIEDSDVEEWIIGSESLQQLKNLRIKHCYKLERIGWESDRLSIIGRHWACHSSLENIELVDCNPLGVEEMKRALPPWKQDALVVHSSWKDKKLNT